MGELVGWFVLGVFVVAVVAWADAAFYSFRMFANRRDSGPLFFADPLWWLPSRARKHFTDQGLLHYRRAMKSLVFFLGSIGFTILVAVVLAAFENLSTD